MRRTTKVLIGAAGIGAAIAVDRKRQAVLEEWAGNPDPTGGDPGGMPEGSAVQVRSADGATLRGHDSGGDGPVCLLIHGFTGTRSHYAPVSRALAADGYRVLTVDQRGHGASTVGDAGFTMPALADDVKAWLEELDLRDVVLSGHSMGGMAVQSFAAAHPSVLSSRVRALVLVSTSPIPVGEAISQPKIAAKAAGSVVLDRLIGNRKIGPFLMRGTVGEAPVLAQLRAIQGTFVHTKPANRGAAVLMMADFDFRDSLRTVEVPTTVIVGSLDNLTEPANNRLVADAIVGAEYIEIPGKGHMLPWEAPERVSELFVHAHKQDRAPRR